MRRVIIIYATQFLIFSILMTVENFCFKSKEPIAIIFATLFLSDFLFGLRKELFNVEKS